MENASRALIIAGGMLIAMLIVGLLVFGYTQIRTAQQSQEDAEEVEQLADFNERFEAYNRTTVRGYQIISLGNLVYDTNVRYADYQGYEEVVVEITGLTNDYPNATDLVWFVQNVYDTMNSDQKNALKQSYFQCDGVEYGSTGRVTHMSFSKVNVVS